MWKKTKEMKWKTAKLLWGDLFYDIAGAVLFAAGVYTFAGNADFAPGGITGISLLLNHVFGIPVGTLTLFINLPLIVISYRTLGKRFLLKTAKSMVITTFFLDVVFPVFPMYEGQRMMAALCSGALMGAGMVMFYMRGSSSGGLDFVIMPIKKKRPHLSVGKITMIIDLGIILLGWPVFGDVDAALYVIRYDYTKLREIREGVESLALSGIDMLGYVFNGDNSSGGQGYGYGYRRYGNYGSYGSHYGSYGKYGAYGHYGKMEKGSTDKLWYGLGAGTVAFVVTEKGDEVAAKIAELTKRGVTSVKATGTYTGKKKNVLLCACSKSEAFLVKCAAEEADENMFLMFMETSEVFGEGFRSSSD